ncbi:MAG: hypothetical protein E4H09_00535 [Spirochaetales bacterium]|nr:MAG: hypothetical protein E4H09_00535 [Spirochaetales bacterium]
MNKGSVTLWVVSGVLVVITVFAMVFWPDPNGVSVVDTDALTTTVSKAETYFDFEHYERATETFARAAAEGMTDAIAWYQYSRSVELTSGLDIEKYMTAYKLLLEQAPGHEYLSATEQILTGLATPFVYAAAAAGAYEPGQLVTLVGTVTRVVPGRVESRRDVVYLDTRPDSWMTHMGDTVMVDLPRHRRYQVGDTLTILGWFDKYCPVDDGAGLRREYPCIVGAGARLPGP